MNTQLAVLGRAQVVDFLSFLRSVHSKFISVLSIAFVSTLLSAGGDW